MAKTAAMSGQICLFLIAAFTLQFPVSHCGSDGFCPDFSATFVGVIDQRVGPQRLISDPEETFFRNDMGLRDIDIQHVFQDAVKFFNETYGLDFSNSQPNEQKEYFLENAKLNLFRFHEDVRFRVVYNNWITTGNTRTTCDNIKIGGYIVTFSRDQLLHGSYGGVDGIPARVGDFIEYGYHIFFVCDQSPIIVLTKNASPFRQEPVDGTVFVDFDIYNQVLGYGKSLGILSTKAYNDNPGQFRLVVRLVYTFPAN